MVKIFRHICWVVVGVVAVGAMTCAVRPELPPLTPDQQAELKTLKTQLSDPERTAKTKAEAAILLLRQPYPQASVALRDFLADASNRPAQVAVAGAIVRSGHTDKQFVKPLVAMLLSDEPAIRTPAAEALATCKDCGGLDELIRIVSTRRTDRDVRLVIISAMQRVLDKKAIDVLVSFLDEKDETIRNASCDALVNLTSIRTFGRNPKQWKRWWSKNRSRRRSEWLADLAENLSGEKLDLKYQNAELRRRLAAAMNDLYASTPPGGQDALLREMLSDPLAEVRLVGVRIIQQRLSAGLEPETALKAQVLTKVTDTDPAVRAVAVVLLANIAEKHASKILTGRLKVEQSDEVRRAIYQGLGLLGDASAWGWILKGVSESDRKVASAAAGAMARIVEKNGLSDKRRAEASSALTKRYKTEAGNGSAGLREALLEAMGVLNDERLAGLMTSALKDPAATVRLSGIKALGRIRFADGVSSIAPLVRDNDRGVRLAAIAAVGLLGGVEHIDTILARTDAKVESDAAVRKQAWSVVMDLLKKADTSKLQALTKKLTKRDDADEYLIDVLGLWSERIPAGQADKWIPIRLRLGRLLLKAGRSAESAVELSAVHAAMIKTKDPRAPKIWIEWIKILLASGDASALVEIGDAGKDAGQFNAAVAAIQERLNALSAEKDWNAVVRLSKAALQRLPKHLSEPQVKALTEILRKAKIQRQLADKQRVATLLVRLTGTDDTARHAAAGELATMKGRAVKPLIEQLRKIISSEKPDPASEKAVLDVLLTLAPKLKGYDPKASATERLKTLDGWIKGL